MAYFPRTLKIGGLTLKVSRNKKDLLEDCLGNYSYDNHLIAISPDLPVSATREVLLHEVVHACWEIGSLSQIPLLTKHQEHIVSVMAIQMLDVIRHNPRLVEFLTQ